MSNLGQRPGDKGDEPSIAAPKRRYIPNYISLDKRATYLAISAGLIGYAVASLLADDFFLWLPGGRRSGGGSVTIHLHGASEWIACAAIVSACLSLVSVIADHHDHRDNEIKYQKFARATLIGAGALLVAAVVLDLFVFKDGTYVRERTRHFWSDTR